MTHNIRAQGFFPASGPVSLEDGELEVGDLSKSASSQITHYLCECGKEFETRQGAKKHLKKYEEDNN